MTVDIRDTSLWLNTGNACVFLGLPPTVGGEFLKKAAGVEPAMVGPVGKYYSISDLSLARITLAKYFLDRAVAAESKA